MRVAVVMSLAAALLVPGRPAAAGSACGVGVPAFPGDDVSKTCEIRNLSSADGGFAVYVTDIVVRDDTDTVVTDPRRDTYIGFFSFSLETERILTAGLPTDDEEDHVDLLRLGVFRTTCDMRALDSVTSSSPCQVGRVRKAGARFDRRAFRETLHFLDVGDQSDYIGWSLAYTDVMQVRVPPLDECGSPCPPVYLR